MARGRGTTGGIADVMDISTTEDCDEDGWLAPERGPFRLPWPSAVPVISSASVALWAAVALLAVTLFT